MLNNMYTLPEIHFVGGASKELQFNLFYDESAPTPYNFSGGKANFSIVNLTNKNSAPLVSKSMTVSMNDTGTHYNTVSVLLLPSETVDLFGKFVYQITLKDANGNIDLFQGILNIYGNINKSYTKSAGS